MQRQQYCTVPYPSMSSVLSPSKYAAHHAACAATRLAGKRPALASAHKTRMLDTSGSSLRCLSKAVSACRPPHGQQHACTLADISFACIQRACLTSSDAALCGGRTNRATRLGRAHHLCHEGRGAEIQHKLSAADIRKVPSGPLLSEALHERSQAACARVCAQARLAAAPKLHKLQHNLPIECKPTYTSCWYGSLEG